MNEPSYHLEGIVRTRSEEMEDFNGPLDVILLLLSKNKIEIEDVSITAILEQYLAYLDEMKRLDMEIASEFITMASHLMVIKTKMLLSASEQAEAESEMELLRQSLVERQRKEILEQIRQAVQFLEGRNEIGRGLFTKGPESRPRESGYRYQNEPADLARALAAAAERTRRRLPPPASSFQGIVGKEPFPVTRKAKEVIKRLVLHGIMRLRQLFRGCRSRSEIVATFLAVLELCRTSSVWLTDDGTGDNPELKLIKTPEEAMRKETDV